MLELPCKTWHVHHARASASTHHRLVLHTVWVAVNDSDDAEPKLKKNKNKNSAFGLSLAGMARSF